MPTPHYGQPRYRAIADELRRRIECGVIASGSLLPAESALTTEFQASRGTIRQAIAALRNERLVTTEHGRGTYANPKSGRQAPAQDSGGEARQRRVAADSELAVLFDVDIGATLIEQQRVVRTDGAVEEVVRTYQRPR
ncbi:GntR family transcriptional regulator [Micromonospora sp. NPDC005599]|uniref:GntR family transcriptional regulator n=1 Tax=unclassified Micromonospora TaxID=2617518 RepID=UPI0033B204F0